MKDEIEAICVLTNGSVKGYVLFKEDVKNNETI